MNTEKIINAMLSDGIFEALTKAERDNLASQVTLVQYKKGDKITKQDEFVSHAMYLVSGFVKVENEYYENNFILDVLAPPGFLLLPVFLTNRKHLYSITSLCDTIIVSLDINIIHDILKKNSKVSLEVLKNCSGLYSQMVSKLFLTYKNNMQGRIAGLLMHFMEKVFRSDRFDILLSRVDLAQITGISRENVIKVLTEFRTRKIIILENRYFQIVEKETLREMFEKND